MSFHRVKCECCEECVPCTLTCALGEELTLSLVGVDASRCAGGSCQQVSSGDIKVTELAIDGTYVLPRHASVFSPCRYVATVSATSTVEFYTTNDGSCGTFSHTLTDTQYNLRVDYNTATQKVEAVEARSTPGFQRAFLNLETTADSCSTINNQFDDCGITNVIANGGTATISCP